MSETQEELSIDYYFAEWIRALESGDFEQALTPAIGGYRLSRAIGDEAHEKVFLAFLKTATDNLHKNIIQHKGGSGDFKNVCSFCCQPIGGSLYVLGANVSICAECIELASKIIGRP